MHGNPSPRSHPRFIADLAERLPELPIIMGHMGGPEWESALEIAQPYANLRVDIGSSYTEFDKVKAAVDALGAERVLFGSGMTEGDVNTQIGVVLDAELDDDAKAMVFHGAAEKLFGL